MPKEVFKRVKTCIILVGSSPMKRLLISLGISLGCILSAWAGPAAPSSPSTLPVAPLTSVRAIRALSNTDAAREFPVAFQATVTYFLGNQRIMFVQDGNSGIFVKIDTKDNLVPGDRVLIKGTTAAGYRPKVISSDVTVLSHGPVPTPVPATFDELVRGRFDSVLITAHGLVESAELDAPPAAHVPGATLRVLLDGGHVDVLIDSSDSQMLDQLLDADVEITGVAGGKFDGKFQLTGIVLHVTSFANFKIRKRAPISPWSLPITPMDQVLSVYHVEYRTSRVRVSGTITYFEPGSALVLENGAQSIWIKTQSLDPMQIGDKAEAAGFPAVSNGFLTLDNSAIRDLGTPAPAQPVPATWPELSSGRHIFDLVSIEGQVVMEVRESSQDEYVLSSDGHAFSAIYTHQQPAGALLPMKEIPVGTRIRVAGICAMDNANPYGHEVPFKILMRTPDDLAILAEPSWFTVRHLGIIVLLLLLAMLAVGARAWFIDRTMRAQVAELGYLGQRRALILEDINNSRPLPGILERITELGSASLKGAPCWCQLADGPKLGNCPPNSDASGLRVVEQPIAARSGPTLGSIFAAFDARTAPNTDGKKALAAAADLATLAIETARLYSDLIHRSEFDMLTDIKNRFCFEKHLDCLIDEGYRNVGIFGLIYIDLDDFKQVNDGFGHHIGDQYMQQAALRMKRQLRPEDILARLGGDEFGVLVPVAQNRSDVEEIALRLACCFEDPFAVEGHMIHGSASIGVALYPADGMTGDALLNTADAAMYMAKKARKSRSRIQEIKLDTELTSKSRRWVTDESPPDRRSNPEIPNPHCGSL
jgi:diguanylate cyclase (GGDEF)-like protein